MVLAFNQFNKLDDAGSYDLFAGDYGRFIEQLGAPLGPAICRLAALQPGDKVLDIGCGTGLATRYAAKLVGSSGAVIGIDLSAGMIEIARAGTITPGMASIDYLIMDAEQLALPNCAFNAVISLCAVAHFPHLECTLKEMVRVVKPGGHVVVSMGRGNPLPGPALRLHYLKEMYRKLQEPIRPRLKAPAALTSFIFARTDPPPEAILTEWTYRNPRHGLQLALENAGLYGVRFGWAGHVVRFTSAQEFWNAQFAIITEVRRRLESTTPEKVAGLRQEFLRKAQSVLDRGGDLIYPYGAFFVSGQRPT